MAKHRPFICIVDDDRAQAKLTGTLLTAHGFRVRDFPSADAFLACLAELPNYDLLISDLHMPGKSGYDLCRAVRKAEGTVRVPIIMITGSDLVRDKELGLEAGADDFVTKPFDSGVLLAKIRSLLEIRSAEAKRQSELESSRDLNQELRRFLSPNIASRITDRNRDSLLSPHRAEVTVLFCDLRGFTAFSEKVEPEEVLKVLTQYYTAVGQAAIKYKGTLGHLAGDGIMVFFNDPEPVPNHDEVALRMALESREALLKQKVVWDERAYGIDFGMGISSGFATIGGIGFDRFSQYSVIGTVTNFASRLCHLAVHGQILVSERFIGRLRSATCTTEPLGEAVVKGIDKPVLLHNVMDVHSRTKSRAS